MNDLIQKYLDEESDKYYMRQEQEREENERWKNMTWNETNNDILRIIKEYSKRKHKHPLFITLKAIIPTGYIMNKYTWNCYLQVTCKDGVITEMYASAIYVESIFGNSDWKESNYGEIHFFTKPIGNPIKEKKVRAKVLRPPSLPQSPFLRDILITEDDRKQGSILLESQPKEEDFTKKSTLLEIFAEQKDEFDFDKLFNF